VDVQFGIEIEKAELVDLMEENGRELKIIGGKVRLPFRGFEIHTMKVIPTRR